MTDDLHLFERIAEHGGIPLDKGSRSTRPTPKSTGR